MSSGPDDSDRPAGDPDPDAAAGTGTDAAAVTDAVTDAVAETDTVTVAETDTVADTDADTVAVGDARSADARLDDALRSAVGLPGDDPVRRPGDIGGDDIRDDEDDGLGRPPSRPGRLMGVLASLAFVAAVIAVVVILGRINSGRYRLTCAADRLVAERGRSLPPWGYLPITGPGWKPVAIPPAAECVSRRTSRLAELEGWYLGAVVDRITAHLTPHDASGVAPAEVDAADALLAQALLLTRNPVHRDQRDDLERLLGDVTYWRAIARVRAAADGLDAAAKAFTDAAAQRPRHATDAAAWAERSRRTAAALRAGADQPLGSPPIAGAPAAPSAAPAAVAGPQAPPGVALPVEAPEPAPTGPDAGVASGGVLL